MVPNAELLRGEVAIVTGGGRGVGAAVARALAAAGAAVAVAARSTGEVEAIAAELRAAGGSALAVPTDVTDERSVAELLRRTYADLGPPTLLVNNAGVWRHVGPLADAVPDAWWADVEVTLRGAFLCSRAVLPGMLERAAGRIVNVSSYAAIKPQPYATAYASGKAALLRLTDSLAAELAGTGVTCIAVTPGFVRTDLVEGVAGSPAGRRYLPELSERDDALEPERAGALIVAIAAGRLDALAGRFVHVLDDADELVARADAIAAHDAYVLRLRSL